MRVLITGGAGFIGSHTVERFLSGGWDVEVLDNYRTGSKRNLSHLEGRVEIHYGSVEDMNVLKAIMMDVDAVVHLAAVPSVMEAFQYPLEAASINVDGTVALLEAARETDVGKVVFSSSSAVYGEGHPLPLKEEYPPRPMSNYAVTKVAGEGFMEVYAEVYGLKTVSLRYFNVFGPRQNPESDYSAVIPKFISALLRGQQPVIYGDGEQSRDFIYVKDVAEANYLSVVKNLPAGTRINIASGVPTTVNQLLKIVSEVVGVEVTPRYAPPRPGDIRESLASVDRMKNLLGFTPSYTLKEGMGEMVSFMRSDP
ncbi:MAG: NAD-dependent epimerase/dehydratase family protein [Thermoplasmata archaeon]|nr:NAD-dependent epimerase/dehydratase family protein [Thermoplasmata archaeon]